MHGLIVNMSTNFLRKIIMYHVAVPRVTFTSMQIFVVKKIYKKYANLVIFVADFLENT